MQKYFATQPTDEIARELYSKVESFDEYLSTSGLMTELRRSYKSYYGDTKIRSAGVQGELQAMEVNHYASLVRSILTMVTSQRPAWEPRATNTDVKSQSQTVLASGLLDYYMREKRLERALKEACQTALFLREGWLSVTWNATAGEIYHVNPDTGVAIAEGDIEYRTYKLQDVIRDFTKTDGQFDWIITRRWVNKYDLAAKYPELSEKIVALQDRQNRFEDINRLVTIDTRRNQESIEVPLYTFFHKKSDVLPNGRIVEFLASDIALTDGPLPYRRVPVFRISAEDMFETAFGHSPALDILPVQTALNTLFSTVLSNQAAFGVQNVMVPKGSGLSVSQISGGMNLVEYDAKLAPPQALNLTQTPPEVFNFINMLIEQAQTISGVNAVARGNAPASLSGAAMALLQSTALQFSSGVQQSYIQLLEEVGTNTIHTLADFAVTKRVAYIVGKHNRSMIREFSSEDIANVSRVTVDSANPLTKTVAGRTEIANQLLNAGMIKRPEQYLMVLQTGQLEPVTENETSELINIRAENEGLSEGAIQVAVITDDHRIHILEHKSVLSSPEARRNPEIVQATLAHIQEHIDMLKTADPILLQMMGQQSLAPAPAPQNVPQAMNGMNPVTEQAESIQGPQMPIVAGTDERFQPQGGLNG